MAEELPPLVEVWWDDHTAQDGHVKAEVSKMVSIGYLEEETEEHIVVARTMADGKPYDKQLVDKRMMMRKRVVRR